MMENKLDITYMVQPPKRYTFEQPKLKEWVEYYCKGKVLNLFAGKVLLDVDEFRVDLDQNAIAHYYGDAYEFLNNTDMRFDTVILDPPYSLRKAREKYDGKYIGKFTNIKNNIKRVLNKNGRVITLGYSSVGMSKSRGFKKIALCVVCHNGDHDDTIGVVEDYCNATEDKDLLVTVETTIK